MEDSIELKLIGITYNQIESGVYALILEDVEEGRRLAIVIGYPEAQSIECRLQKVKTPRPLSHDLMACLLKSLDATLLRVDISRLPTGPYAGMLTVVTKEGETKVIDARSSDAIALAIRTGAPIFASRKLMAEKGFMPDKGKKQNNAAPGQHRQAKTGRLANIPLPRLEEMLGKYVSEEKYEEAAEVKSEIERRKNIGNEQE